MKIARGILISSVLISLVSILPAQDDTPYEKAASAPMQRPSMSYRGKRMKRELSEFCAVKIIAKRMKSNYFAITLMFNIPLDPRTVTADSVKVNGKSLPARSRIVYNKEGTALRVMFPIEKEDTYTVDFEKLSSFNGIVLEKQHFENICDGCEEFLGRE